MKNNIFEIKDFFMVRRPIFSANSYFDLDNKKDIYESILKEFNNDSILREALLIGSNSLYKSLRDNIGDKDKIIDSFIKYYIRMTTRTTPFGLFSGITMGEFSDDCINMTFQNDKSLKKYTRVDSGWLLKLIKKLESDESIIENIKVKSSKSFLDKGERLENKYYTEYGIDEDKLKMKKFTVSIKNSNAVKLILNMTQDYIYLKDLVNIISESNNIGRDNIKNFIIEMIEKEYLITELRINMSLQNPLKYLEDMLSEKCKYALEYSNIVKINNMLDKYNSTKVGEGEKLYLELIEEMKKICENKDYLQVDLRVLGSEYKIENSLKNDLNKLIEFLTKISVCKNTYPKHLEEYKREFIDKYSEGQEVSLVELIDEGRGIGYPATYTNPKGMKKISYDFENINRDKLNKLIKKKLNSKATMGTDEITITDDDINGIGLDNVSLQDLPTSFEINLLINKKVNGKYDIALGPAYGSGGLGKMFGRFSNMLTDDEKNKISSSIYSEVNLFYKDKVCAELTGLHTMSKASNVAINQNFLEYELPIGVNSSKDYSHTLNLEDLVVGINNNKFYLKSKLLNKQVVLFMHNMLNTKLAYNIYRLLLDISRDEQPLTIIEPLLSSIENSIYTPRIKYNEITIFPETWMISLDIISDYGKVDTLENFKITFKEWSLKNKLKKYIYITKMDNRLLLNIDNDSHLRIIYNEIKNKNNVNYKIEDASETINYINNSYNSNYFTEIVIPVQRTIRSEIEEKSNNYLNKYNVNYINDDSERVFLPLDKWIYLNLNCEKDRQEELICKHIYQLSQYLYEKKLIKRIFFIRYFEQNHHIRLRLEKYDCNNYEIERYLNMFLKNLYDIKIINGVSIETYVRELERYGGIKMYDKIEDFFCIDSEIVMDIFKAQDKKMLSIDKKVIGVISIIKLMEDYGIEFNKQLEYFDEIIEKDEYRKSFLDLRKILLKLGNSNDNWNGLKETNYGTLLFKILSKREKFTKELGHIYKKEIDYVTTSEKNIIFSLIHMHCNRLYGINRILEREVMALTRHTLYSLKYFKQ